MGFVHVEDNYDLPVDNILSVYEECRAVYIGYEIYVMQIIHVHVTAVFSNSLQLTGNRFAVNDNRNVKIGLVDVIGNSRLSVHLYSSDKLTLMIFFANPAKCLRRSGQPS